MHIVAHGNCYTYRMKNRVSMAKVASELGVSASTVSRALRNDSRISEEMRAKVKATAEQMGYRPNPMISALMLNRGKRSRSSTMNTIALITDYGGGESWKTKDVCRWEYIGLMQRADELGFRLEEFAVADFGGDLEQLENVLRNRGIQGIILGFSRSRKFRHPVPSDDFVVAGLSAYFRETMVDRSNFHGMHNVRLALNEIRKLGYKRTGLVIPELNNRMSGYQWSASALDWQRNLPAEETCRPFIPDSDSAETAFRNWMASEKPDSLLVYKLPVKSWLARMELRIPQDIGVAYLFRSQSEMTHYAGIDGNLQVVGSAAVDLVVEGLITNRLGLPEHPKEVLIKGTWQEGETLRRL